jgi:hypothetical protein
MHYPPEHLITEVLADAIAETDKHVKTLLAIPARQRDEDTRDELSFWKRQRQAYTNALADFEQGRRLIATEDGYLAPSTSRPGTFHRCYRAGGVWMCSCEAGDQGVFHRHTALISAYERADELAVLAMPSEPLDPALSEAELTALEDRAAAADILADAADERRAQALDDGWLSDESVADLVRRCEMYSRYAA